MKPNQQKNALALGGLTQSGFRLCSQRKAKGLMRLGGKARLIPFQEPVPLYDFLKER